MELRETETALHGFADVLILDLADLTQLSSEAVLFQFGNPKKTLPSCQNGEANKTWGSPKLLELSHNNCSGLKTDADGTMVPFKP